MKKLKKRITLLGLCTLLLISAAFWNPKTSLATDNTTPATATEIILNQAMTDSITYAGENNWFKITLNQPASIICDVATNNGYLNYNIYNSSMNELYSSRTLYGSRFPYKVNSAGTYYIKISEYMLVNYSTNVFTLNFSVREQDQWEYNDTAATALQVTPGQTYSGIAIEAANDNDWFKINVDHACSIVSSISMSNGNIKAYLYNSSLTQIAASPVISSGGSLAYKVGPGTYYIKLSEYSGINYFTNAISLTVNLREQDPYENNDTSANATVVTPGQTFTAMGIEAPNDVEWLKVNVDYTCNIISEMSNLNNGYLNYTLYNSSLSQIYSSMSVYGNTFSYRVNPGTYYIKISEYSSVNYLTNSFNLKVSLSKEYDFLRTYGNTPVCTFDLEPVNLVNGNFYSEDKDLSISTRTLPLEFIRYYNSRSIDISALGKGWRHNYDSFVTVNTDNSVDVAYPDGHNSLFTLSGGIYISQAGVYETLVKNADGTYTLTFKDQKKYLYNTSKKLYQIKDKNNNITTLQYTNSLLTSVTEPAGRSLQFTYDTNGRLTTVTDPLNRTLVFTYDTDSNLATAKDLNDGITSYAYDSHGITIVTDPNGHIIVKNVYDSNSKVIEQEDGKGQKSYISYDPVARINTLTDVSGNVTNYYYDALYRQTKIVYPDQTYTQYTYDSSYNKIAETDPRGKTTTFTYDTKGNVLTKSDPSPLNYVTTYTYDSKNNVTSKTDAAGLIMNFTYDTNGNLTQTSKTIGTGTAITTYTYDPYGQMLTVTNANGKTSQLSYDNYGNVLQTIDANNNATSYTYDLAGRKLTRTNTQNQTWTFTYDNAGNILTETDPLSGVMTYTYDPVGNPTSKTDQDGNTITYTYDENDRLVQTTDQLGQISTIVYDANGNKTTSTDVNGHSTTYTNNSRNMLLTTTDAEGATTTFTYDANGNILSKTNGNNQTTQYEYDVLNRLVKTTDPLGVITQKTYDAVGNILCETDGKNQTINYVYNEDSRLLSITDSQNNITSYTYDLVGNKLSATDARGKTWIYMYDNMNRLIKVTDPTGHYMELAYDSSGNVTAKTDENGHQTVYTFDAMNKVTSVTDPLGNTTTYTYDDIGNLVTATDANNNTTTYTLDALSRIVMISDAQEHCTNFTYDAIGNVLSVTDAKGQTWSYTYDDSNRITQVTDPLNHVTQTAYDPVGNIVAKTDANSQETEFSYDGCGQLISVTDALDNTTHYEYDANGNLIKVTDARGKERTFEYDAQNRLINKIDPLGKETTWAYDAVGNLTSRTKPGDITINYTYDDNNRLTTIAYPDQSQVAYTYDPTGKRLSMSDPNGNTTYTYDDNNRLLTMTRDNKTITYEYDTVGNITQITYPNGMEASYTFDSMNQIATASVNGNTLSIGYNELGSRTEEDMPNGVVTTYQYDANSRLTLLEHQLGETTIASSAYELDSNGNRLTLTDENNGITEYTYDPLGQLTQVTYPDDKIAQYTYDAVGNRLGTGGTAEDKLVETAGTTSLSYDYEDRLIEVQDGSKMIQYAYDGDGNLIAKTISGSETASYDYYYDYSAGLPRLLVEQKGENTYNYIYAGRLYSRVGPNGEVLYYHQDGLGSTLVITDATGTVKNRYKYDAFGNPTTLLSTVDNSLLFTGELYDQSGYIYLKARYYDPLTGRFITQDSNQGELGNPLSQNLYAYCGNNPVNYIDPSGNSRCNADDNGFNFDPNHPPTLDVEKVKTMGLGAIFDYINQIFQWLDMYKMHQALDMFSILPGPVGDMATLINTGLYLNEGNYRDAGISAAGLAPVFGTGIIASRLATKGAFEALELVVKTERAGNAARTAEQAGISASDARRIQNAASRTNQEITVVGSRANGTSSLTSDWDYILSGNSAQRHSAMSSLPRGTAGGGINSMGRETGIDIFTNYPNAPFNLRVDLDPTRPHVIFRP